MWEVKELGTARRDLQNRFRIYHEQLDIFSEEAKCFWYDEEVDHELMYKQGFAKELLACIGDHLSIADLQQIIEVFQEEYDIRENGRQKYLRSDK